MTKKIYIVHGWDGHPNEGWYPWLKKELVKRKFSVRVPQLPEPEEPRISSWIPALSKVVENPNLHTYLIGHSLGCQTIARYLVKMPTRIKVGGVIFVAGFFKRLTGLEDDQSVQETSKHWLNTPINLKNVKGHIKSSIAIFSDNDPYVPLDNSDDFKKILKSKLIIEHNKGHFSGNLDNAFEVPVILNSLLELSS